MNCYQDALSNIMPVDWFEPYGRTPFANGAEMSVDITIVETEDGIRAKSVKNPPRAGSSRLIDAIKNALGMGFMNDMDDSEPVNQKESQRQSNVSENSSDVSSDDREKPEDDGKKSEEKPDSRSYISTGNKTGS